MTYILLIHTMILFDADQNRYSKVEHIPVQLKRSGQYAATKVVVRS